MLELAFALSHLSNLRCIASMSVRASSIASAYASILRLSTFRPFLFAYSSMSRCQGYARQSGPMSTSAAGLAEPTNSYGLGYPR